MCKRKTTEEFISEAIKVHGDKYDYSKVEYINARTPVSIICPNHGEFSQTPNAHLSQKQGCRQCYCDKKRIGIMGIGVTDIIVNKRDKREYKIYTLWKNMIARVNRYDKSRPLYQLCTICKEWYTYSNFKSWVDDARNGYIEGYHLDKDILIKGNKVYSPNTCSFVPAEVNALLTKRQRFRGDYPIGVCFDGIGFTSSLSVLNRNKYLGYYATPLEAFNAYKTAKEEYIKELAEKYFQEGKITERVYNALMKYEVEITD